MTTTTDYCDRCGMPVPGWEPYFDGEVAICYECEDYLAARYTDEVADVDDGIDTDLPWLAGPQAESVLVWGGAFWLLFTALWVLVRSL